MSSASELLLKLKLTRENLRKPTLTRFDIENSLLAQNKSEMNSVIQEKHKNDRNIMKPVKEPKKDIDMDKKLINHKIVII